MFKANSIPNTVSWRIGTKEKGYLIKMPSNEVISGLPILTVFKPFDPNFHNAVMHVEDEAYGEGEIVEVLQKGYVKGDKVIRYAMVKVAN